MSDIKITPAVLRCLTFAKGGSSVVMIGGGAANMAERMVEAGLLKRAAGYEDGGYYDITEAGLEVLQKHGRRYH